MSPALAQLLPASHSCLPRSSLHRWSAPAVPLPASPSPSTLLVSSLSSYGLRGVRTLRSFKSNLLQLVEQSLVADLQFLRGPPPVPAGTRQCVQDQLPFRLARGRPRRCLQRNSSSVDTRLGLAQQSTQTAQGHLLISQRHQHPGCVFQ